MSSIQTRVPELALAKSRREGRKIIQATIAEETGLNPNTVSAYWNSTLTRFDTSVVVALCEYFDCEIGDLLVLDEEKEEAPAAVFA